MKEEIKVVAKGAINILSLIISAVLLGVLLTHNVGNDLDQLKTTQDSLKQTIEVMSFMLIQNEMEHEKRMQERLSDTLPASIVADSIRAKLFRFKSERESPFD